MVITRKIEIYVHEEDKEQKKAYMHTLYVWRDAVRKAANMIVSHKFVQQNVRDFMYLQDDILARVLEEDPDRRVKNKKTGKETVKYNVSDTLKKEKGLSEQNTTYRLVSSFLKGVVPSDIYTCLNQSVSKTFKETVDGIYKGESALQSYKNSMPIPFSAKSIANIHKADDGHFYFTLFGIPFVCMLGRDRSNNEAVIDSVISGEYKLCSSSIAFQKVMAHDTGKKKQKMFLLLCVDIPKKEIKPVKGKVLYAYLGVDTPINCSYDVQAKNGYDSGIKWAKIGSAEEFLYRRVQIQAALRRCQVNSRYSKGGKGRKRKLQAIERFHEKETNYVETKAHTYSKMLVDLAVKYRCETICLVNQKEKEEKAKSEATAGNVLLLRNWSYFGLKQKIKYKANRYGIKVDEIGKINNEEETTDE